jgi:hypothetical protein
MKALMKLRIAGGLLLLLMAGVALADEIELNPSHPDRYIVAKGDTLWDIAGKFLAKPWQWPEIWHENRQIADPHWIFPGDELVLTVVDGRSSVQVASRVQAPEASDLPEGDLRLSPSIRISPLGQAIPTIPLSSIQQFLIEPKVADAETFETAPYIVGMADEHVIVGVGDKVYVRGAMNAKTPGYLVFRAGPPYLDAETGEVLGYEALYVGNGDLETVGDPSILRITKADREVIIGDRVMPIETEKIQLRFQPHPPAKPIWGHIISVVDGVSQIGQWNIVVIDRGIKDGIDTGTVLEVRQSGVNQRDTVNPNAQPLVALPPEKKGLLMVFRAYARVSFALVLNASAAMHINDAVSQP